MNAADLRRKAIETLAVGGRQLKEGGISSEEWIEAIEEAESLMASARRKEAEEMAELKEGWTEIKARADASIARSEEVRRELWRSFVAGAISGGCVVYMMMWWLR